MNEDRDTQALADANGEKGFIKQMKTERGICTTYVLEAKELRKFMKFNEMSKWRQSVGDVVLNIECEKRYDKRTVCWCS